MQPYSLMKDTSPAIRSDGQNRRFTRSHLLLLKRTISDQMTAVKEMAPPHAAERPCHMQVTLLRDG